jgi:hypothetical protein
LTTLEKEVTKFDYQPENTKDEENLNKSLQSNPTEKE